MWVSYAAMCMHVCARVGRRGHLNCICGEKQFAIVFIITQSYASVLFKVLQIYAFLILINICMCTYVCVCTWTH